MAGLAATRIFSAAGAGGLVLTYWALRKAGMPRRRSACRMVAFLVLTYSVYLIALVVFGVLLRTGVLPGDNPVGGEIVPAALAFAALLVIGLIALIPGDFERRLRDYSRGYRARATRKSSLRAPRRSRPACERPSTTCVIRSAARSRWPGPWASGPRTSASCGRASRRLAGTWRSGCWCRDSSWGWQLI